MFLGGPIGSCLPGLASSCAGVVLNSGIFVSSFGKAMGMGTNGMTSTAGQPSIGRGSPMSATTHDKINLKWNSILEEHVMQRFKI